MHLVSVSSPKNCHSEFPHSINLCQRGRHHEHFRSDYNITVMVTMSEQSGFENWHMYGLELLSLLQK